MTSSADLGRKKMAIGVGAALLLVASLITVNATVGAQASPTADCQSDNAIEFGSGFIGLEFFGNRLLGNGTTQIDFAYDLPAGTYDLNAVAIDSYVGRETITQPQEQWSAQFLGADGSVLATSGVTGDLPDFVETGLWSGSIGEVTLASAATSLRVVHVAPGSEPNSVRPVCLSAWLQDLPAEVLESSITVDFDSENIEPSTVSVICVDGELTETDTAVDLVVDPVTPGTTCTVDFPTEPVCTMSVTPEDEIDLVVGEGTKTITFPEDVAVDVLVDIDCDAPEADDPCLLYTSPSPRDKRQSRMPSSA